MIRYVYVTKIIAGSVLTFTNNTKKIFSVYEYVVAPDSSLRIHLFSESRPLMNQASWG